MFVDRYSLRSRRCPHRGRDLTARSPDFTGIQDLLYRNNLNSVLGAFPIISKVLYPVPTLLNLVGVKEKSIFLVSFNLHFRNQRFYSIRISLELFCVPGGFCSHEFFGERLSIRFDVYQSPVKCHKQYFKII